MSCECTGIDPAAPAVEAHLAGVPVDAVAAEAEAAILDEPIERVPCTSRRHQGAVTLSAQRAWRSAGRFTGHRLL